MFKVRVVKKRTVDGVVRGILGTWTDKSIVCPLSRKPCPEGWEVSHILFFSFYHAFCWYLAASTSSGLCLRLDEPLYR